MYCCGCEKQVKGRLTDGKEIYPHRPDLASLPFWKCDTCENYVGCHHKTDNPIRPLGCIPTKELKNARNHIHRILDPLWKSKKVPRKKLYTFLSGVIGREYHTGDIRSLEEARTVYRAVQEIAANLLKDEV